jgi:5-methylcytosine-specific restriction enzyme A
MKPLMSETSTCQLCGRDVPRGMITLHHLRPRQKGGMAEDRTPLCRPCHKQLHATFSNKDLARHFTTIEALRAAESLQPFLGWIRKQKPDRNFRADISHGHGEAHRAKRRRYR